MLLGDGLGLALGDRGKSSENWPRRRTEKKQFDWGMGDLRIEAWCNLCFKKGYSLLCLR